MTEKNLNDLKNKVTDFKRFSFIILAITSFLAIGLVLPTDFSAGDQQGMVIGIIAALLIAAFYFHRSAMNTQHKINEEE